MSVTASRIQTEVEAAYRKVHAERQRRWRKENRERDKVLKERWRQAHYEDYQLAQKLYRFFYPEKVKAAQAAWVAKNPNYFRERRERLKAEGAFKPGGKYHYTTAQRKAMSGKRGPQKRVVE